MPSERFKRVVILMSLLTVATYVGEPYLIGTSSASAKPAAGFSLPTIDGSTFRLLEHNNGTPVLVDFMATWCVPCRQQLFELSTLRAKFLPSELVMISLDTEYGLSPSDLATFRNETGGVPGSAEARGWFFAVDNVDEHVALTYNVNALPMLILIDGSGNIAHTWFGLKEAPDLQLAVEGVLGAPA